jgi:transcriptional regulator with XRE-family HTH domain
MIKNEKEYKYSQDCAKRFVYSLEVMEQDEAWKQNDPSGWQLSHDVKQSHLMALQAEITEYEMLTAHDKHKPIVLTIDDIHDLPQILIKARIAAKLSQQQLADLAGLTAEQIQHYEANDYEDASFLDVMLVINTLDIKIQTGEFLVPLDILRRTPITKEELLAKNPKNSEQVQQQIQEIQVEFS